MQQLFSMFSKDRQANVLLTRPGGQIDASFNGHMLIQAQFGGFSLMVTDGHTDGRTNERTDKPTDRDVRTHLEIRIEFRREYIYV